MPEIMCGGWLATCQWHPRAGSRACRQGAGPRSEARAGSLGGSERGSGRGALHTGGPGNSAAVRQEQSAKLSVDARRRRRNC